jgi:hypothetical protein
MGLVSGSAIRRWVGVAFLVGVLWILIPLGVIELGFRWYEDRYLLGTYTIDEGAEVFQFQDLGYVEGPVPRLKLPGEFRILSLGDSFAASIVQEPLTYASVLERELFRRLGRPVRVVNLGLGRTSFSGYLHQLDLWGRVLEFDAVLLNIYSGNDFFDDGTQIVDGSVVQGQERGPDRARSAQRITLGPATHVPHKYSLRIFDWIYAIYHSRRAVGEEGGEAYRGAPLVFTPEQYIELQAAALESYVPEVLSARPEGIASLAPLLKRLRDLEQTGTRTLVFVSPPHAMVSSEVKEEACRLRGHPSTRLRNDVPARVVREVGVAVGYEEPIFDIRPCLERAKERGEELYYVRNTHWNARGNELVGQLLAAHLAGEWFGEGGGLNCTMAVRQGTEGALKDAIRQTLSVQASHLPLLRRLDRIGSSSREQLGAVLERTDLRASESPGAMIEIAEAYPGFLDIYGRLDPFEDGGESALAVLFADGQRVAAAVNKGAGFRMRPSVDCVQQPRTRQLEILVIRVSSWSWAEWRVPQPCQAGRSSE